MKRQILGVTIDDISEGVALAKAEGWLKEGDRQKLIFTPGPEFLVTATRDPDFKKILNSADLNLPDGFGLKLLAGVTNIVPGVEFLRQLCRAAAKNGWTVGLIGGRDGVAYRTAEVLRNSCPGLKVSFCIDGEKANQYLTDGYTSLPSDTDILFVGFGHPKQEKVLRRMKEAGEKFRLGMGVGGSFDFISGQVAEPPAILSGLGLKWLGRLVTSPAYMLPKAFRATVQFPLLLLKDRTIH